MPASILVVDDDEGVRRVVVVTLERAGYTVGAAADYESARPILDGPSPLDLLVTDLRLGEGTPHGYSIARLARVRRPDLKLIVMTGGDDPEESALAEAGDLMLQKPFRPRELLEMVQSLLAAEAGTPGH
jgi:CheY-like chemotaxis protein